MTSSKYIKELINECMSNIDPNTRKLKKLPWVASARKYNDHYIVRTKKDALRLDLVYRLERNSDTFYDHKYGPATLLTKPIRISLPEYLIKLTSDKYEPFYVKLANTPENARDEEIGVIPTYHSLRTPVQASTFWFKPCYGNGEDSIRVSYNDISTWEDKANEVAMWLQTAEPHYGKLWYRTAFAYRLGLVGDEVITN